MTIKIKGSKYPDNYGPKLPNGDKYCIHKMKDIKFFDLKFMLSYRRKNKNKRIC